MIHILLGAIFCVVMKLILKRYHFNLHFYMWKWSHLFMIVLKLP